MYKSCCRYDWKHCKFSVNGRVNSKGYEIFKCKGIYANAATLVKQTAAHSCTVGWNGIRESVIHMQRNE